MSACSAVGGTGKGQTMFSPSSASSCPGRTLQRHPARADPAQRPGTGRRRHQPLGHPAGRLGRRHALTGHGPPVVQQAQLREHQKQLVLFALMSMVNHAGIAAFGRSGARHAPRGARNRADPPIEPLHRAASARRRRKATLAAASKVVSRARSPVDRTIWAWFRSQNHGIRRPVTPSAFAATAPRKVPRMLLRRRARRHHRS